MKTALYYLSLIVIPCAAACSLDAGEDVFATSDAIIVCDSDADCPAGLECELEHGERFCKWHGGDDANGSPSSGGGASGGASIAECASDADCPAGEECEEEHGERFCKPHGGH